MYISHRELFLLAKYCWACVFVSKKKDVLDFPPSPTLISRPLSDGQSVLIRFSVPVLRNVANSSNLRSVEEGCFSVLHFSFPLLHRLYIPVDL